MLLQTAVLAWVGCSLVQGAALTPLVRARGVQCITALLLIVGSASFVTLTILLASGALSSASFSLPAFYSGLLLASSFLLLAPSILLLSLSALLLTSLLASFLSTCLLYSYSRLSVLGFEYDADGAMHFSALLLTTLIGACGIGCLLVAVAARLTAEEAQLPKYDEKEDVPVPTAAVTSSEEVYVDVGSMLTEGEETSGLGSGQRVHASINDSVAAFSSLSSSTLCPLAPCTIPSISSMVLAVTSSHHFHSATTRLALGFVTSALSALLYCVHLVPVYATQRDGILRLISMDSYMLSIQLGLLALAFTVCPLVLRAADTLSQHALSFLLTPALTAACCVGGALAGVSYWWVLAYMPAHAFIGKQNITPAYEWFFFSAGSDLFAVAAQSIPRFALTALAFAVSKEHKLPMPAGAVQALPRPVREEMRALNSESVEEAEDGRVQRRVEVEKELAMQTRVSWSSVSLWCLALVLGAVSDGVAAFAWDEGY